MEKLLFTINEAAEMLAIGRTKTYEFINRGELRTVRVDGSVRVTRDALEGFVTLKAAGVESSPTSATSAA